MHENLSYIEGVLANSGTLEEATGLALGLVKELGFTSVIYDYSPVAITLDGALITPSQISVRNVPDDMVDQWCSGGLYQCDPVQHKALSATMPFVWSCRRSQNTTDMAHYLTEDHEPVVSYMYDYDMTLGMTVPIQLPRGGLATFTTHWVNSSQTFVRNAKHNLAVFGLIGQVFHQHADTLFSKQQRKSTYAHLTPREQECLRYSAEGFSAKEIAYQLKRSVPTITQHLQTAARKLGARNRVHAVMLAHHYRLLE